MKNLFGIIGTLGLVLCFAGVSTMETAILPGLAVAIIGLGVLVTAGKLIGTIN